MIEGIPTHLKKCRTYGKIDVGSDRLQLSVKWGKRRQWLETFRYQSKPGPQLRLGLAQNVNDADLCRVPSSFAFFLLLFMNEGSFVSGGLLPYKWIDNFRTYSVSEKRQHKRRKITLSAIVMKIHGLNLAIRRRRIEMRIKRIFDAFRNMGNVSKKRLWGILKKSWKRIL